MDDTIRAVPFEGLPDASHEQLRFAWRGLSAGSFGIPYPVIGYHAAALQVIGSTGGVRVEVTGRLHHDAPLVRLNDEDGLSLRLGDDQLVVMPHLVLGDLSVRVDHHSQIKQKFDVVVLLKR